MGDTFPHMTRPGGTKKKNVSNVGEAPLKRMREKLGITFERMHCKRLQDFTPEEIRAIEREYNAKVIVP